MTTITIERALLEQALEALESCDAGDWSTGHVIPASYNDRAVEDAINDLRAALAAPATAPEKTVQEIMEFARHYAANTFSSATLEDKIRRSLAAPATVPEQPAWQDAPTVPGLWAHDGRIFRVFPPEVWRLGGRCYGPIQEDKE